MKRKWIAAILLLSLVFGASACSQADSVPEDILLKIDAANTRQAMLQNSPRIAYTTTLYDATGDATAVYTYCDSEKYVYDDGDNLTVDQAGTVTSYWREDDVYETTLYIGQGAYETEQKLYWPLSWFRYNPQETVTSSKVSDGTIAIQTEYTDQFADVAQTYGYSPEDVIKVRMHYVVNAKTYEIESLTGSLILTDGTAALCLSTQRIADCEAYTVLKTLLPNPNGQDLVTITLIESPQQQFTYTIPTGHYIYLTFSTAYESVIYLDAAFTEPVDLTEEPVTETFTGYIKKMN